jgi:Virus neck protein
MATSQYFNNYNALNEQRIVEDLIVESIKIMGFDAYYLPNNNDEARDILYGEDPVKKFQSAFPVEFYLSSSLEYMGEKEFFSKFGLEIKNNINVILSKRSFSQRVPQNTFTRPREGDLIYVPFMNGVGELFEIKFADQNKDFNMLGRKIPFFYELELEKFKYSHEVIDTGIQDIDQVVSDNAYTIDLEVNHVTGNGTYLIRETVFQSSDNTLANASAVAIVQTWTPSANSMTITNIAGEFSNTRLIIGETSNARYSLVTFDPQKDNVRTDSYDNQYIEQQGASIIDFTEINPFGSI